MATEQYANNVSSTLNGAIGAGDGTIVVASATGFPTTGNFRVLIDLEILLVTAVSGTTFTVTRGAEGTTAASHSSGATVTHVLTRDGLKAVGTVLHPSDSFAALDGATLNEGVVGFPDDGLSLLRHGSSSKLPWGPVYPFTRPVNGDFSWVNQGTATITELAGGLHLRAAASGSGAQARLRVKTAPSTPYVITAYLLPVMFGKNFHLYGIGFRESSSGKLVTFDLVNVAPDLRLRVNQWASPTSLTTSVFTVIMWEQMRWLRIEDDGSNRKYHISADGQQWIQCFSETRTTHITADQISFHAMAENSATPNLDVGVTLLSWKQT